MAASRNSRSPDLPQRIADRLAELLAADPALPDAPSLTVALSGGRDSVALITALARQAPSRRWSLAALHVHHGLSPHADAWAHFCAALCARLGVPLQVRRVQVHEVSGEGLEAAARRARYEVFAELSGDGLILGHHRDDQAETLLFNLLRGAGLRGLAAMPARRLLPRAGQAPLPLLRPLLELPRHDLETWLQAQGQSWIEDESNADTAYARNFLRREVLPLLQRRFPAAASLARAARLAGEAEAVLEEVAAQDLAQALIDGQLQVAAVTALSPARERNLLRYWLRQQGAPMPDAHALEELCRQLHGVRPDSQVEWHCAHWVVRVWRGALFLAHEPPGTHLPPAMCRWSGAGIIPWGGGTLQCLPAVGRGLADRCLTAEARFLPRRGGELLRLPGRPQRPVKKLLQEANIPPWLRDSLPLLWLGPTLAWVPGLGVAEGLGCAAGEPGWDLRWDGPDPWSWGIPEL